MPAAVAIMRQNYTAAELRREVKRTDDADVARRMLASALVLEGKSRGEAARSCGMDRQILCDWVYRYNAEGLKGLHNRTAPGAKPKHSPEQQREVAELVRKGPDLAEHGVVRGGGSICRVSSNNANQASRGVGRGAAAPPSGEYRCGRVVPSRMLRASRRTKNFADLIAAAIPAHARSKPIELWWQDEARVGQQGTVTRVWAERGSRPRAPATSATTGPISLVPSVRRAMPVPRSSLGLRSKI